MKSKTKFLTAFGLVLTALILFAVPVAAQQNTNPTAFLVYYDDDFELEVFDSAGDYIGEVFIGMELFPGSTIKTYNTSAEIQLDPNGSILKISENSVFQIEAFQTTADESNDFSLFNGKLRVIAARAGLGYENYSIITQSAVCGVRGTDFVIDSIGVLAVRDGEVSFSSLLSGDTISVISGQIADVFADTFAATAASAQSLASVFSGMDFNGTDPGQVPGHTPSPLDTTTDETADDGSEDDGTGDDEAVEDSSDDTADDEAADDGTAEDGTDDETPEATGSDDTADGEADGASADGEAGEPDSPPKASRTGSAASAITAGKIPDASASADSGDDTGEKDSEPGPLDNMLSGLGDIFGFEVGSIIIDGTTYAKAVVKPEFEIGKLRASLYLPVIYQDNLFEPSSWYKPAENNEWSFGTDQDTAQDIAFDILNDLFLKIEYIQWGDNGDDFYLKFGNLNNMTIGHGILMRNFSNNFEFPAVRKVGINTGIFLENFGFEAVLDNAADPTIFGGRLAFIPFGSSFPMQIALSGITDINPDSEIEDSPKLFDPLILNAAFDFGLPVSLLNMTIFADLAGLTVYSDSAWHTETFYNPSASDFFASLNNYGVSAGIFGNLFTLDYRLEYRLSKGIFTPAFYGNNYLLNKTQQYDALIAYIDDLETDPTGAAYQDITMGVYGELAMNIFDAVTLTGGYLWPWELDASGSINFSEDDYFTLSAALMPDVIPVAGVYGSVSYTRAGLVSSVKNAVNKTEAFTFLNPDTLISGEIVYPFDPSLDIALMFTTALPRDEETGALAMDEVTHVLENPYFAMSIDMRIHF